LIYNVERENPKAFSLNNDIKQFYKNGQSDRSNSPLAFRLTICFVRSVAVGLNGEFIDSNEHRPPSKITYVLYLFLTQNRPTYSNPIVPSTVSADELLDKKIEMVIDSRTRMDERSSVTTVVKRRTLTSIVESFLAISAINIGIWIVSILR